MKQYEYKVVQLQMPVSFSSEKICKELEEQLNRYGESGWKLCGIQNKFIFLTREVAK